MIPIFRQIRETVGWLVSEPMLVYYLKFWKGFFWPEGELAPPSPLRDEETQARTRSEAKSALIRNIPGTNFVISQLKQLCKGMSYICL